MIVYCMTGPTGKQYVGITTQTLSMRFAQHKWHSKNSNLKVHRAMRELGVENFKVEIIDSATTLDELFKKEALWIAKLDSQQNGYNSASGGYAGPKGFKNTEKEIKRKRVEMLERWSNQEKRDALLKSGIRNITKNSQEQKRKSALGHAKKELSKPLFEARHRKSGELIGVFQSPVKAAKYLGIKDPCSVREALSGTRNRNFIFTYLEAFLG